MTTYAEIQEQIKQLQEQAEQIRKDEIQSVISDINSKIALYNIKQQELKFPDSLKPEVEEGSKQPKDKLPPKYRNEETGEEWSGRGPKPKWIKDAENEGKDIKVFLINKLEGSE
ncbi:MAG: H-NS histone family protein [Nitrososphaeraceae archaeon]